MDKRNIAILMSTYNGAQFIKEQLNSVINQEYTEWQLFIRDDGSSDATINIVLDYLDKDKRINLIDSSNPQNIGVKKSFLKLLNLVDSDIYMFCDQDDIWLPTKIGDTLQKFQNIESSTKQPTLVHTDLTVVDYKGKVIIENLKRKNINDDFQRLILSNDVTGCTVMINKALRNICLADKTDFFVMHDWWLALIASSLGNIGYLTKSTIFYRQHGSNEMGANYNLKSQIRRLKNNKQNIINSLKQAEYFCERYGNKLTLINYKFLQALINIKKMNITKKLLIIKNYKFRHNSILGSLYLLFWLIK